MPAPHMPEDGAYYSDQQIEQALVAYCIKLGQIPSDLFSLTSYDRNVNQHMLGLVRDIRINLVFCQIDYSKAGILRSKMASVKQGAPEFITIALCYQHCVSNFIFRFRALGDKIMRLVLYICSEDKTKSFEGAKSKIGVFLKICEGRDDLREYKDMADIFRKLNEQYRTDEAHNVGGKLRKSILTKERVGVNDPVIQIGNYWNVLTNRFGSFNKIYELTLK